MTVAQGKSRRIASIELIRFLAAVSIMWLHMEEFTGVANPFFGLSYIFLEFFFGITGYYMMASVSKNDAARQPLESVRYSFRKAKEIYPVYLAALLSAFVVNAAVLSPVSGIGELFSRLFHFKWEFFYLQMLGFNQAPRFNADYLLGPGWYLSAMFIALVPVHALARKLRGAFSDVVAPLVSCAIYYYCIQQYGTLNVGNETTALAMLGVCRAVAGLSMGAFWFALGDRFARIEPGKISARLLAVLECGSLLLVLLMPLLSRVLPNHSDALIYVPLFGFLTIVGNGGHSALNRLLGGKWQGVCAWLGRLSLYVYLFHWAFILAAKDFLKTIPGVWRYAVCFAAALPIAALVMVMKERISARRKAYVR